MIGLWVEAFSQDDLTLRVFRSDSPQALVLGRVVPGVGSLKCREFKDYESLWFPVAFEHLDRAASGEEATAVGCDRGSDLLGVGAIAVLVRNLDIGNQIGGNMIEASLSGGG
jgi:hypothetical protein